MVDYIAWSLHLLRRPREQHVFRGAAVVSMTIMCTQRTYAYLRAWIQPANLEQAYGYAETLILNFKELLIRVTFSCRHVCGTDFQ